VFGRHQLSSEQDRSQVEEQLADLVGVEAGQVWARLEDEPNGGAARRVQPAQLEPGARHQIVALRANTLGPDRSRWSLTCTANELRSFDAQMRTKQVVAAFLVASPPSLLPWQ